MDVSGRALEDTGRPLGDFVEDFVELWRTCRGLAADFLNNSSRGSCLQARTHGNSLRRSQAELPGNTQAEIRMRKTGSKSIPNHLQKNLVQSLYRNRKFTPLHGTRRQSKREHIPTSLGKTMLEARKMLTCNEPRNDPHGDNTMQTTQGDWAIGPTSMSSGHAATRASESSWLPKIASYNDPCVAN